MSTQESELSRRDVLLAMLGLGGGYAASQYAREEGGDDLLPTGSGEPAYAESVTLGDWDSWVTNDWGSVTIQTYPSVVAHVSDGLSVFNDGETYRTTIETDTTMQAITTENPADVEINNFPTLLIETNSDGSTGSITLFEEGDL